MTPTPVNGYCTLADLQSADVLNSPTSPSYSGDAQFLCDIITGVSRAIDTETSRYFYQSSSTETRYFDAASPYELFVGDMVSVSAVATDDGSRTYPYTWNTTDYDLFPYDAALRSEPEPYRWLQVTPTSVNFFPAFSRTHPVYFPYYGGLYGSQGRITKGVKVTGVWGWPQVPTIIAKACILWSARIYLRMKSPLGESAASAFGVSKVIPPPDHDVEIMLMNYSRPAIG